MFSKRFLSTYLFRGLIAAAVYCITVVVFLYQRQFQSIWLLFLGNALFLFSVIAIVYIYNARKRTSESSVNSAISGHMLSITGATLSVILSVMLFLIFSAGGNPGTGEVLHQAPANFNPGGTHGMLFILVVNAALGNTISGFFAAIITSFTVR